VARIICTQLGQELGVNMIVENRAVPKHLRAHIPPWRTYETLGTDGFGRRDTRSKLHGYFGVDAQSIAQLALSQLDNSL